MANACKQEEVLPLEKGVIVRAPLYEQGYLSNIFIGPKKDRLHRMILNSKKLNISVEATHFKMESTKNVTNVIQKTHELHHKT